MKQLVIVSVFCFLLVIPQIGCDSPVGSSSGQSETGSSIQSELTGEPGFITVQHILIGFTKPNEGRPGGTSSVPGKTITRNRQDAEKLANDLLKRGTDGEDFGALVKEFTDDSAPGIYKMANFGEAKVPPDVFKRDDMVPAFGNVGFPLPVGGVGLAVYDSATSPYGWHVIKRIE